MTSLAELWKTYLETQTGTTNSVPTMEKVFWNTLAGTTSDSISKAKSAALTLLGFDISTYGSVTDQEKAYWNETIPNKGFVTAWKEALESGIINNYTGIIASLSLRDTGAKGFILKVRRSSDDALQDFTATQITDGTLTTFTGAGDGFVHTWYNTSGNGNHATETDSTKQLQIVDSGSVITGTNGLPALRFNSSDDGMNFTSTMLDVKSMFVVYEISSISLGAQYILWDEESGDGLATSGTVSSIKGPRYVQDGTGVFDYSAETLDTTYISSVVNVNGEVNLYVNGTTIRDTESKVAIDVSQIGRRGSSVLSHQGLIQEVILFSEDKTSDVDSIYDNMNNYYGAY